MLSTRLGHQMSRVLKGLDVDSGHDLETGDFDTEESDRESLQAPLPAVRANATIPRRNTVTYEQLQAAG
jgi:hypothetical protein